MSLPITVIVGAQWGDEGKGKITDYFARQTDYVVRFQGGNNAGHTLVVNNHTYKLHLMPSGVLYSHIISIIGNGVLVDPKVLLGEIEGLKKQGISPMLKISQRAHVTMPYHIAMDEGLSKHQGDLAAGSTKRGIAPVAADKMYRHGIRMGDLLEPELFREKLTSAYQFNVGVITKVFGLPYPTTFEEIFAEYIAYGQRLKVYITDTEVELHQAFKQNKKILFEGAQGMSLDPDHGMYPHTTSTNNVAGYIETGSGVGFNCEKKIIGVMKAYVSRVGTSPFPTELPGDDGQKLRDKGNEYGTTTGRPRRVGWLDLVQLRQSVRVSGLTDLAITKLDILAGLGDIQVCTHYELDGEKITEMPASLSMIRALKPVYETLSGWEKMDTGEAAALVRGGYDSLPETIKKFIGFIEDGAGCRVSIISLGPDREQTIVR
jgi:adenylosuccinate synthase